MSTRSATPATAFVDTLAGIAVQIAVGCVQDTPELDMVAGRLAVVNRTGPAAGLAAQNYFELAAVSIVAARAESRQGIQT